MTPNIYDHLAALAGFVGLGALGYAFIDPIPGFVLAFAFGLAANLLGVRGRLGGDENPS